MPEITRKQFIELLAAAGGASALAGFLPGKWVKPIVKVGVLPVHAQSSGLRITSLELLLVSGMNSTRGRGLASPVDSVSPTWPVHVSFDFSDDFSEVDENALIHLTATLNSVTITLVDWKVLSEIGSLLSGDAHAGTIIFNVDVPPEYILGNAEFELCFKMNGRVSNTITGQVTAT